MSDSEIKLFYAQSSEVKNRILAPDEHLRAIDTGAYYVAGPDGKPQAVLTATTSAQGVGIVRRTNIYDARVLGSQSSAGQDNLTAHGCYPCPYPYTHVQVVLSGHLAATGIIAKVASSAAKGNGYSPVDAAGAAVTPTDVTWGSTDPENTDNPGGGATSTSTLATLPSVNYTCSDIISLPSIPRTDGGSNYLGMLRVYSAGRVPIVNANGLSAAGLSQNGRIQEYEPDWGCGYKLGDYVSTNWATYNASNGDNFAPSAVMRFFSEKDIVSIASYGDSTMTGVTNSPGNGGGGMMGYVRVAARNMVAEGIPAVHVNGAYQSMTSGYFLGNALREVRLLRPSIAVLRSWSINDGYTQAVFDSAMGLLTRAIAVCRAAGTIPVVEVPPPQGLTGSDAARLIAYQNRVRAIGGVLFDIDALTTDGGVNPKIRAELLSSPGIDNVHFGRAGHDYLGAELAKVLKMLTWKFA